MTRDAKPDWRAVTDEALREPASLLRALAAMRFPTYCGAVPRGSIAWWPPVYLTAPRSVPARRAEFAALNRRLRDASVLLVGDADAITAVCTLTGQWRRADGSQRGDDLPSLGALRWGCRYGQAAGRIARTIGLARIPDAANA